MSTKMGKGSLKLYLVQPAESEVSSDGHDENDSMELTPEGLVRANRLGGALRQANIWPDIALSSSELRSQQTGKYCLQAMGCRLPLLSEPALDYVPAEESIEDAQNRIVSFADNLAERADAEQSEITALAFGQSPMTNILAGHILGWSAEEIATKTIPNAGVSLFIYSDQAWEVPCMGAPAGTLHKLK